MDLNSGFAPTMFPRYRRLRGEIQREAESGQWGRGQVSLCPQLLLTSQVNDPLGWGLRPRQSLFLGTGPHTHFRGPGETQTQIRDLGR